MDNAKNIIRLKDVPSNTIEEAIIIFKDHVKVKNYEGIGKFKKENNENNDLVIKEAELIIADYLKDGEKLNKQDNKKIKRLKGINIGLAILLIISIIF